jgi:hypothetical protein
LNLVEADGELARYFEWISGSACNTGEHRGCVDSDFDPMRIGVNRYFPSMTIENRG